MAQLGSTVSGPGPTWSCGQVGRPGRHMEAETVRKQTWSPGDPFQWEVHVPLVTFQRFLSPFTTSRSRVPFPAFDAQAVVQVGTWGRDGFGLLVLGLEGTCVQSRD